MTEHLTYQNDTLNDCFISAVAYIETEQSGGVAPEPTVLKDFKHWCSTDGCAAWTTLWNIAINGLHGQRIKSWGRLAHTQSELEWAIEKYKGFIAGVKNIHEVAVIKNKAGVVVHIGMYKAGEELPVDWVTFIPMLDASTFAVSKKFSPILFWYALKNFYLAFKNFT